ncbi:MAG: ECF transporter S component [Candidatus Thorarchaeota archaeon]|nr:ECF transporter S component [Candidatus Thorarchaeota archaeon]
MLVFPHAPEECLSSHLDSVVFIYESVVFDCRFLLIQLSREGVFLGAMNKSYEKYNSKNIALFAIFLAMIIALEILPIIGITDLKIPGTNFTLDPTGIPIVLVFLFFGSGFAVAGTGMAGLIIAMRGNPIGAVFKFFAEFYKIVGLVIAWWLFRNREVPFTKRITLYTIFATITCAIGMYVTNGAILLPLLYGMESSAAWSLSLTFVPLNVIQSLINVIGGGFIFGIIPADLKRPFLPEYESIEILDDEESNSEVSSINSDPD